MYVYAHFSGSNPITTAESDRGAEHGQRLRVSCGLHLLFEVSFPAMKAKVVQRRVSSESSDTLWSSGNQPRCTNANAGSTSDQRVATVNLIDICMYLTPVNPSKFASL